MAEYIDREELINAMNNMCNRVCDYSHAQDYSPAQRYFVCKCCTLGSVSDLVEEFPAADVITRDEGIKLGAELAAMHGSDATSQDLEKAYWRGFEDAMQKRDVAPVVHGKNLKEEWPSLFECSVCHWSCWDTYCGDTDTYNYCPNCGATMDGKE